MSKKLPEKTKFEFELEYIEGSVPLKDVYVDGVKVLNGHNCSKGHVYLHAPKDTEIELRAHDPSVFIEAEFTEEGLVPVVNEEAVRAEAAKAQKAAEAAAAEKAKEVARKKMEEARKKREFESASKLSGDSGGAIPKPQPPK